MSEIISGFAGAFFAFLFMRLADTGKRIEDRANQHLHSLDALNILFCDLVNSIQENMQEIEGFIQAFKSQQTSDKSMSVTLNRPQHLDFRDGAFDGLGNKQLLNEIILCRAHINRINADISMVWSSYEKFCDQAFLNPLDPNRLRDYFDNFERCADKANMLNAAHAQLLQDAIRIVSIIRILTHKDRSLLYRIATCGIKNGYPGGMDKLIKTEVEKIHLQINASRRDSEQRINAMHHQMKATE